MVSAVGCVTDPVRTRNVGLVNRFYLAGIVSLFQIAEPEITSQKVYIQI